MTKWVDDLKKDYEDKVSYARRASRRPTTRDRDGATAGTPRSAADQ